MPRVTRSTRANPVVDDEQRPALGELEGADVNSSIEAAPEPKKRSTRATRGSGKENVSTTKAVPAKGKRATRGKKVETVEEVVVEPTPATEELETKESEIGESGTKEPEMKEPEMKESETKEPETVKNADVEAEEQLQSLQQDMLVEENVPIRVPEVDEAPAPAEQVAPEPVKTEVKPALKKPKFDPDVHSDHLEEVGNDSFEFKCSPRKSLRQSTVNLKPVVSETKGTTVKNTVPAAEKKPATAATVRAGRASQSQVVTAKPAPNTSVVRTKRITSAAPQSPKLEKRRSTVNQKATEPTGKRVVSGASAASTAASTRTRSVGITFPPPPPPVRSSKPPTVPTFELPGEAFSRKAAAAREERRKRMEEEEKKRKQFKAKPAPKSVSVPKSVFKQHMKQHHERFGVSASSTDTSSPALPGTPERSSEGMLDTPDSHALEATATATAEASSSEHKHETESVLSSSTITASDTFMKLDKAPLLKVTGKKPATVAVSPEQALRQRMKHRQQMEKDISQRTGLEKKAQAAAVLKTRKEAAEKGREAVKMWAEMQKQKQAVVAKKAASGAASNPMVM